jgi:hypothetical protein
MEIAGLTQHALYMPGHPSSPPSRQPEPASKMLLAGLVTIVVIAGALVLLI